MTPDGNVKPRSSAQRRLRSTVIPIVGVAAIVSWGTFERLSAHSALVVAQNASATPNVAVVRPQSGPGAEEVVLPGQTQGLREAPIYARASGYIRRWTADIGTHVKAGDLLAVIDAPEVDQQLREASAELKVAQANAAVALSTARRVSGLVGTDSVSRQEDEDRRAAAAAMTAQVAARQAEVARLKELQGFERVVAPFDGIISARSVDVGNLVSAGGSEGQEMFRISDVSRLRVYVEAPQSYAAELRPGTKAELHFPERPGKLVDATVTRTSTAIDPRSRSLTVELDIDNAGGELLPGSFIEAHFKIALGGASLRIPGNALLFGASGLRVAVVGPDGRVQLKPVTLGRDFGKTVEVTGLGSGDEVILNPSAAIEPGEKVRVVAKPVNQGGQA